MKTPSRHRLNSIRFVDEGVPDLGDILPKGIDAHRFAEWLGPKLGDYRTPEQDRAAFLAPADELKEAERIARITNDARKALADLPLGVERALGTYCAKDLATLSGVPWGDLQKRMVRDLTVTYALLGKFAADHTKGDPGRPSAATRDALIASVVKELRGYGLVVEGENGAREITARILFRCGIRTPTDPDRIKVAARRGRKTGK